MIDLDFNKIKHFLPYFGSLLILLGYLKMSLFYSHFNINISEYVDFTEMITAFIPDLVSFCLIFFIIIIFDFIVKSKAEMYLDNEKDSKILNNESLFHRMREFFKQNIQIFIILIVIILLNVFVKVDFKKNAYYLFLGAILLFKFIFLEYNRKHKLIYNSYLSGSFQNIITLLFINVLFVYYSNIYEIQMTEKSNNTAICFNVSEKLIQSNENLIFVGQTNRFLFMHDKKVNETFIYQRDELKNMSIRKIGKR